MPALAVLEAEGFRYLNYVDTFDGGPTLECDIDRVRAIRKSHLLPVNIGVEQDSSHPLCLVGNDRYDDFRVVLLNVDPRGDSLVVTPEQAGILRYGQGDSLRVVTLSGSEKKA